MWIHSYTVLGSTFMYSHSLFSIHYFVLYSSPTPEILIFFTMFFFLYIKISDYVIVYALIWYFFSVNGNPECCSNLWYFHIRAVLFPLWLLFTYNVILVICADDVWRWYKQVMCAAGRCRWYAFVIYVGDMWRWYVKVMCGSDMWVVISGRDICN